MLIERAISVDVNTRLPIRSGKAAGSGSTKFKVTRQVCKNVKWAGIDKVEELLNRLANRKLLFGQVKGGQINMFTQEQTGRNVRK